MSAPVPATPAPRAPGAGRAGLFAGRLGALLVAVAAGGAAYAVAGRSVAAGVSTAALAGLL
ncbi:MAG: hypothetical protein ABII82_08980, partial [Verrucomicrobiota bacterium]